MTYKIIAKALAMCINYMLLKIIPLEQTKFNQGRYIMGNFITSLEKHGVGQVGQP